MPGENPMKRTAAFARDSSYEALLQPLNATLADVELPGETPQKPVVLVQGLPRSGTTVLYQLLAQTGCFTYPSNLVARFYRAPAMGLLLQRLARPFLEEPKWQLTSRAGLTEGWFQPHEFGYFWRHHLGIYEHHELEQPVPDDLILQLGRMEAVGDGPLLLKNGLLAYALPALKAALPTLCIVRIRRDPRDVAASILAMRSRYYDDPNAWWSLRPKDVSGVEQASPEEQVAFQVRHGGQAIDAVQAEVDLTYAELCDDVHAAVHRILDAVDLKADLTPLPASLEPRTAADLDRWTAHFAE